MQEPVKKKRSVISKRNSTREAEGSLVSVSLYPYSKEKQARTSGVKAGGRGGQNETYL